jgi:hypothetical protein
MKPICPWYMRAINRIPRSMARSWVKLDPHKLIKTVVKELELIKTHGFTSQEIDEITKHVHLYLNSISATADLSMCGRIFLSFEAKSNIRERLRVELYHKLYPETKDIEINDPIVITGLPRTGSTILARLMACDKKRLRPMMFWESNRPAPVLDNDGNIIKTGEKQAAEELKALTWTVPNLKIIHLLDNNEPEECVFIQRQYFLNWMSALTFNIPAYKSYLMSEEGKKEVANSYKYHKKALQVLTSTDKLRKQDMSRRWLLKSPYHMFAADAIMEEYPNVKFVCLHRDPLTVFPSFSSLEELGMSVYANHIEPAFVGKEVTEVLTLGLNTFENFRQQQCNDQNRFLDIRYEDIVDTPIDVVKKIYKFAGLDDLDTDTENIMIEYLRLNPQNKFGEHKYSLTEYSIDAEAVKSDLDWYYNKYLKPSPPSNADIVLDVIN